MRLSDDARRLMGLRVRTRLTGAGEFAGADQRQRLIDLLIG